MKSFVRFLAVLVFALSLLITVNVCAANGFDDAEYNNAVALSAGSWNELVFDNDLLIKVNVTDKDVLSLFEITADGDSEYQNLYYYVHTKGGYAYRSQSGASGMPGRVAVPHLADLESGYLKIGFDENLWLRGKTVRVRVSELSSNTYGWENAAQMGLNEEHIIKFTSMNDVKWFKLVVPVESFRYTYSIEASKQGAVMGSIYKEEDLKSGSGDATFCDCINISPSLLTVDANMGMGTYYIKLYPAPISDDVLNTKFIFATDNTNPDATTRISTGAIVSNWAKEDVEKAYQSGLIPQKMERDDLTKKVTREEFAAIALEVYEKLSKKNVTEAANCHFGDIGESDYKSEIQKAYAISAVQGMSDTTYEPRSYITREQLATILCRVLQRNVEDKGKVFSYVDNYRLFADDAMISDWAKPSVYFMASNGLVKGIDLEANLFAPRNTTAEEEARGYASATKEQALIIALRMFEKK